MLASLIMGGLVLAAFLAVGWWFSRQDASAVSQSLRALLGAGAVLAGIVLSLRGAVVLGGPIGLWGLGMLGQMLHRRQAGEQTGTPPPYQPPAAGPMTLAQARAILGVEENASAEDIRAAHRALMKKLHPDTGEGSAELARQVQEARDLLLAHLDRTNRGNS